MTQRFNTGIFGRGLSGKTTLARELSREWNRKFHMDTLAYIVNGDEVGAWDKERHVEVFTDECEFWQKVWATHGQVVIVEEAAVTIARERDLIPVFTTLRHNEHRLIVVGHSGMELLPAMRQSFQTLYLFRQDEDTCKVWAKAMLDKGIMAAMNLEQYYFLRSQVWKPSETRSFKLSLSCD